MGKKYLDEYVRVNGKQGITNLTYLTSLVGDDLVGTISTGLNKLAAMAHPALGYVVERVTDYVKNGASAKSIRDYINSFVDDSGTKTTKGQYRYTVDANNMMARIPPPTYSAQATGLNTSAIVHAIDPA